MEYFRNQDVRVKLDGEGVKGANSFSLDYSYPHSKVNILGRGIIGQNYAGTPQSNGSISALVLDDGSSLFQNFTGNAGIISSGVVGASDVNFGFNSGYINNYSLRGDISSFPSDSISFDIFNKVESINGVSIQDNIGQTGISSKHAYLSGSSKLEIEHIQSFDYSISTSWTPSYIAGSHFPVEVNQTDGYSLNLSVELIARESQIKAIVEEFNRATGNGQDLSISIGKCVEPILYKIPKAHIDTEGLNSSANGFLEGTLRFTSYLERLEDLL